MSTKIEKLLSNRGFDLAKLIDDKTDYTVTNLNHAAKRINQAVCEGRHIHVVADYDCDGVMSGSILYLILRQLGADFTIRFPKRMSEGYGISEKILKDIPDKSLVITIDNGIAAVDTIALANSRGMDVIILDHHQMREDGVIPNAMCTVNPHVFKKDNEFEHYCGAGLGYKLAVEMNMPKEIIDKITILAAIATIQDVVPLIDDNRVIVKKGLKLLNDASVEFDGLYRLCDVLKLRPSNDISGIQEEDIAFQIGPCINAMGRMLDDGARDAFEYLMHYDVHGSVGIDQIIECNKARKDETVKQQNILEIEATKYKTKKTTCMVLYAPELKEGLIGINAAKVCEKYNMPAIVFTDSDEESEVELLKGSARSVEGIDMKAALDSISELIYKYGGHAGAAGLSIEKDKLQDFSDAINKTIPKVTANTNTWKYDFEITESELPLVLAEIRKYAPYGEGFPAPVVRVNNYHLIKNYGKYYREIGDKGISLNGANSEAISFNMKEKFRTLGNPLTLNIVGTVGYSSFSKKPQVMINDMQGIIKKQEPGFLL